MTQRAIPAVFIRGGTSKGLFFHQSDLPEDRDAWDGVFLAAIGSPDPYGRQLDGLGGGISSLSKVMVVARSTRPDVDVDYTFGQVSVDTELVDYQSNCGNLTSAIGPFAVDEELVDVGDGEVCLRLYNTNSNKIIESRFRVRDGRAEVDGDVSLPGVAGTGAPIRLAFMEPGGAVTDRLLPTGNVVDKLKVPGFDDIEASIIDAATAAVFVRASDLGLVGTEMPEALEGRPDCLELLEAVRKQAAIAIGLPPTSQSVPKIGFVAPPGMATTLAGKKLAAGDMHLTARIISMGRPHRALPLTGALAIAVAARIKGTIVNEMTREEGAAELIVAQPSGLLHLGAAVEYAEGWHASRATVVRTARRLMEGRVLVPESRLTTMAPTDATFAAADS